MEISGFRGPSSAGGSPRSASSRRSRGRARGSGSGSNLKERRFKYAYSERHGSRAATQKGGKSIKKARQNRARLRMVAEGGLEPSTYRV